MDTPQPTAPQDPIVARADRTYRIKGYAMTLAVIGMGLFFAYDGWVRYPAENRRLDQIKADLERAYQDKDEARRTALLKEQGELEYHNDAALLLQRVLGFLLPPLGVVFGAWWVHRSRGEYRLAGDTLSVPGHPPVNLDHIVRIDKTRWERKGIALLDYEAPDGRSGRIKLDDFVYQRPPTDAIFQRIEQHAGIAPTEPKKEDGE